MNQISGPFFSIIIPVNKPRQFFDRCLNSLLQQTYQNFEVHVICVADTLHNKDEYELWSTYEKLCHVDKRFIWRKLPSKSDFQPLREYIMTQAKGRFVIFLDGNNHFLYSHLAEVERELHKKEKEWSNSLFYLKDSIPFTEIPVKGHFAYQTTLGGSKMKYLKRPYINYRRSRVDFISEICLASLPLEHLIINRELIEIVEFNVSDFYLLSLSFISQIHIALRRQHKKLKFTEIDVDTHMCRQDFEDQDAKLKNLKDNPSYLQIYKKLAFDDSFNSREKLICNLSAKRISASNTPGVFGKVSNALLIFTVKVLSGWYLK
jgi:cellulose synthase/poly-beta-1,6-N-acetylglucosamine synthase-like glycosyltransferase